jgi:hydrogenase maturation protease
MARVLIVGYGNVLRSDDGLGVRAAEALAQTSLDPHTKVLICHQLGPEVAEQMSESDEVLFIDADRQARPGELRLTPVAASVSDAPFAHQLTPQTLLWLSAELYGRRPATFQISVGGKSFDLGANISDEVAAALPRVVELAKNCCSCLSAVELDQQIAECKLA